MFFCLSLVSFVLCSPHCSECRVHVLSNATLPVLCIDWLIGQFSFGEPLVEDLAAEVPLPPLSTKQQWRARRLRSPTSHPRDDGGSSGRRRYCTVPAGRTARWPGRARWSGHAAEASTSAERGNAVSTGMPCATATTALKFERWVPGSPVTAKFRPDDSRLRRFSEEKKHWSIPRRSARMSAVALASIVGHSPDEGEPANPSRLSLHCLTMGPMGVHSYFSRGGTSKDQACLLYTSDAADE